MEYKRFKLYIIVLTVCINVFSSTSFAYVSESYTTPDSWSKHIDSNGVKSQLQGVDFGEHGILKAALTTRLQLKAGQELDYAVYEYARISLLGAKLAGGEVNFNLNMRGAYNSLPYKDGSYHQFYDGIYTSRPDYNFDYRIYAAYVEFNKVIPLTDVDLGRIYLTTFDGYKIDGFNVQVTPSQYLNLNVYYGLPVSYYSNLQTQVVGTAFEIPIDISGTKLRGEYSYFMDEHSEDLSTHVLRGRIDQSLSFPDIISSSIYVEGSMIGKALLYDIGFNANIDKSKTGIQGYIAGQYDKNRSPINPYVSLYEGLLSGSSEYIMGGLSITQGITDYLLIGAGYEGRYNFTEAYGDRDFHRVYGNIDLIGLIHKNNYLSLIVDWYNVLGYRRQTPSSKVLGGIRMTQVFTDKIEAWLGVNVQNFRYNRTPIKSYQGESSYINQDLVTRSENTTLAYLGGMFQLSTWCMLQLDYTYEYADLFKSYELQPNIHTVELWLNFIW